jgi:membrane-bound lytic murein transglycosylase D
LALAAYNCGEGRVRRRIRSERTNDFWALRRLPRQTAGFVPRYMAATIIAKAPEAFGFRVQYHEPVEAETVTLDGPADLRITADCLGMEYDELKELNPELTRWCSPPEDPWYDLRIPAGLTPRYLASLSSIRNSAPDTYIRHRVREGECLWRLSRRYNVPIATLAEVNELRNRNRIGIGQTIMVPMPASSVPCNKRDMRFGPGQDANGRATAAPSVTATDARTTERRPWNGIRASRFPILDNSLRIEPLEPQPTSGG